MLSGAFGESTILINLILKRFLSARVEALVFEVALQAEGSNQSFLLSLLFFRI
jgi:hypothetical protein